MTDTELVTNIPEEVNSISERRIVYETGEATGTPEIALLQGTADMLYLTKVWANGSSEVDTDAIEEVFNAYREAKDELTNKRGEEKLIKMREVMDSFLSQKTNSHPTVTKNAFTKLEIMEITRSVSHDIGTEITIAKLGMDVSETAYQVATGFENMMLGVVEYSDITAQDLKTKMSYFIRNFLTSYGIKLEEVKEDDPKESSDVAVRVDNGILFRLALNVAQNSIKAAKVKGEGEVDPDYLVRTRSESSEDGSVKIIIEDNGPGYPTEIIRRGFESGQSSWSEKSLTGEGVGLAALASSVSETMGGRLYPENIKDESGKVVGSRLILQLPVV